MLVGKWLIVLSVALTAFGAERSPQYETVQRRLASGWNTWDVNSVTTHVLLPAGIGVRIGVENNSTLYSDAFLSEALIGRMNKSAEEVFPGPHSWDGSYSELRLTWRGHSMRIQSAHVGQDLALLVTPLPVEHAGNVPATVVFSVGLFWNSAGSLTREGHVIRAQGGTSSVVFYLAGKDAKLRNIPVTGPYFAADLTEPVGLSTGRDRSLVEIQGIVEKQRAAYEASVAKSQLRDAIETTLGWDTIYEPERKRVISPVSRLWSTSWGGYVLFDWDTFFAASMAAIGSRDLAYADALEVLREATPEGFVPNYARGGNWKSSDRSEPPVGAITVLDVYKRFHERWFLEDAFGPLLKWNRWWAEHRSEGEYLVWGSDGQNQPANLDDDSRGTRQGAILESGLDNSPMYDSAAFDASTHHLMMADVGLIGMYVADCDALASIADALGKLNEATELRARSSKYKAALMTLWSDQAGMFLNKDLKTGQLSMRLSPTNFYPMLAHVATPEQTARMVKEHLLNEKEFWGEWVIPSIARDDAAFKDQNYWRGRIWGPMNYLVYLGLRNYEVRDVRREFAQRSWNLFLREWQEHGHVHENYNAITGSGDDVTSSDRFYHWGALLGLVQYLESGEK